MALLHQPADQDPTVQYLYILPILLYGADIVRGGAWQNNPVDVSMPSINGAYAVYCVFHTRLMSPTPDLGAGPIKISLRRGVSVYLAILLELTLLKITRGRSWVGSAPAIWPNRRTTFCASWEQPVRFDRTHCDDWLQNVLFICRFSFTR